MTWELRGAEHEPDDLVVALYNQKVNAGKKHPPIAFRFAFEADAIRATPATLADSPDLLARASLPKRITVALMTGALTTAELAEHLDVAKETVDRIVRRMRERGDVVAVGDARPSRWGMAAR